MEIVFRHILYQFIDSLYIYGYFSVALSTFMEGISIPFPSLIILVMAGFLVSQGKLNLFFVIFVAAMSYTLGSGIPYFIGSNLNGKLLGRFQKYLKIPEENMGQINNLFAKYGEFAVCFTRPILIGNYISYFAGLNKMSIFKFYLYTFLGIFPWAAVTVFLGYRFGSDYKEALVVMKDYMAYFNLALGAAVVIFLIVKRKSIYALYAGLRDRWSLYREQKKENK